MDRRPGYQRQQEEPRIIRCKDCGDRIYEIAENRFSACSCKTLVCGHKPSPHSKHTTGTATTKDGEICWDCAEKLEREAMRTSNHHFAYLTKDGDGKPIITNWPGRKLARVTEHRHTRVGFGGERIYFSAVDDTGVQWHGNSVGFGMFARLHRRKIHCIKHPED